MLKASTLQSMHLDTTLTEYLGALCGSEFVNQHFLTWFKKEAGDFNKKCKELGLAPTACIKQASARFEDIKQEFTVVEADPVTLTIQGADRKLWNVRITR